MATSPLQALKRLLAAATIVAGFSSAYASDSPDSISWHDPMKAGYPTVQNRAWADDTTFHRLPAQATRLLTAESRNDAMLPAGLAVGFFTDAEEIKIRINPDGEDPGRLFQVDRNGIWHQCRRIAGTTPPTFAAPVAPTHGFGTEYRYYLPHTQPIDRLEIGTGADAKLKFAAADRSLPIVVYGRNDRTEAQQEWISGLQRNLDLPTINLAIAEAPLPQSELTALIGSIPSRLYILDFTPTAQTDPTDNTTAIAEAVKEIRRHHRSTPILVISDDKALQTVCDSLGNTPTAPLHRLACPDARRAVNAIETTVREILGMKQGSAPTTVEVSQRRDIGAYDWHQRHLDICHHIDSARPSNLLIGNSIVHYWGGKPGNRRVNGPETWRKVMEPEGFVNMGCGWDRIENVLWRIYHGEIDHTAADNIVVMIGTNNLASSTPDEICEGIGHLIEAIGLRQPRARIILVGLLPRRKLEPTVARLNQSLEQIAAEKEASYINPGKLMLLPDGKIDESLFLDGLHPNDRGYAIIAPHIVAAMKR